MLMVLAFLYSRKHAKSSDCHRRLAWIAFWMMVEILSLTWLAVMAFFAYEKSCVSLVSSLAYLGGALTLGAIGQWFLYGLCQFVEWLKRKVV